MRAVLDGLTGLGSLEVFISDLPTKETIAALLRHADRAIEWIEKYGDKDGEGFVEYERLNEQGLINQGWKDSWDGINLADGHIAEPPIALNSPCPLQSRTGLVNSG
ncbi:hypothetical protein ARGLB_037_01520 [Arthrobacter globiformis NBRC 12137]|uniref:Uncharacterized protein n=1 Tax=Arthrobacter globiformis (strain ATCC 8010 / DSM 20124 / JCM 1332 / NBRC 12137 / NCIMB 8907 / NRRL B-2979 / 168) TaxID=1077972 RepID=H0QK61_ARTG1|nr:hypothetical protein ARGLB_037_01520 [Arthrobacter globiformis NBRC 12137]